MLRIIFYTIIVVLILSFFGISLQSIVHSPAGESNFGYLGMLLHDAFRFIATQLSLLYEWIVRFIHTLG